MDLKKVLPIAVIGLAVIVLVIYAAFKPASTPNVGITNQAPAANTQVPQTPAPQTGQTGQTAPEPLQPADPVSSTEPATLIPAGTDLKQYCEKYYTAWKNSEWQTAYDMQPLTKKQQKDLAGFSQGLQGYGMVNYEVGEPEINGNAGAVSVKLDLGQNGTWATNWSFVKNDKGQWTVQNSVTGMSQ